MMKVKPVKLGKTERMSFSHIDEVISMPNLIEVQKNSYQWFLGRSSDRNLPDGIRNIRYLPLPLLSQYQSACTCF